MTYVWPTVIYINYIALELRSSLPSSIIGTVSVMVSDAVMYEDIYILNQFKHHNVIINTFLCHTQREPLSLYMYVCTTHTGYVYIIHIYIRRR